MQEVLAAALAFPAIVYTAVLALALIYWLSVVIGALDLDMLGGADADLDVDGVAKGVLEGAAKGAIEGAVKGSVEGAAKGVAEAAADPDGDDGALAGLFAALQLNRAPATVVLTLIAIFGWLTSVLATINLAGTSAAWGPTGWAFKLLLFLVSIAIALPLTSLAVRPLAPFFATYAARSKKDLVGHVCVISTARVDARFGQATLEDGGAGLILDVRCDTPDVLRRGDRALLVSWDAEKEVFYVEPMDDVLAERPLETAARSVTDPAAPAEPRGAPAEGSANDRADISRQRPG